MYETGFFMGRLQHVTEGHGLIVDKALALCDRVLILVGSSQESGTRRNPFDAEFRVKLLEEIYSCHPMVQIGTIPDMTHENDINFDWGRWVIRHVKDMNNGVMPDLMVYGNDESRNGWFDPADIKHTDQLAVSRGHLEISATEMRSYIMTGSFEQWKQYANPAIHSYFNELRERLLAVDYYKNEYERLMGV